MFMSAEELRFENVYDNTSPSYETKPCPRKNLLYSFMKTGDPRIWNKTGYVRAGRGGLVAQGCGSRVIEQGIAVARCAHDMNTEWYR